MAAYLDHIAAVNPHVNAIVSLRPRAALLAEAEAADAAVARGEATGPLHGLPQAIKDRPRRRGCAPPSARRSSRSRCRRRTPSSSPACARRGPSSSARPTCRNSATARTATTRSSA
ncbi:amidase family protein [Teichococcus aestuarii]|uniref:amidase family protein n=1 Tax=Teichococcus aestuarii TaxID=568898 RepID=UPI003611C739